MLQVIGAGLPRTGTTSMKAALERLGFDSCYHMLDVRTHPEHVDPWERLDTAGEAGPRTRDDWAPCSTATATAPAWTGPPPTPGTNWPTSTRTPN
ncbi:sulfotransferase [Streptomyces adelaidensis]|uniref:sulfotransferase n=1 Tax=Streptomyces adelaidensis TaxID=2796465 RepID=UPI001908FE9E